MLTRAVPCCVLPWCPQVQEYCDMGTLSSIASTWEPQEECDEQMLERLQLLRDAAQGLEALHTNHVVHGDVVSAMSERMCVAPLVLLCGRYLPMHHVASK